MKIANSNGSLTNVDLDPVSSICWSRKGKQLACGLKTGKIAQVTPGGVVKKTHEAGVAQCQVLDLLWLEGIFYLNFILRQCIRLYLRSCFG